MKHFIISLLLNTLGWFFLGTIPINLLNSQDPIVQERLAEKLVELVQEKKSNCQKVELVFVENEENKNMVDIIMLCEGWGI